MTLKVKAEDCDAARFYIGDRVRINFSSGVRIAVILADRILHSSGKFAYYVEFIDRGGEGHKQHASESLMEAWQE